MHDFTYLLAQTQSTMNTIEGNHIFIPTHTPTPNNPGKKNAFQYENLKDLKG